MSIEWLDEIERELASDTETLATGVVTLAAIAGRDIEIEPEELHGSARRAILLLAAGGDPSRGLDLHGRAVESIATELDSPDRREALQEGIELLRSDAAGLPHVSEAVHGLLDAPDVAWRAYACSLLAERLAEEGAT